MRNRVFRALQVRACAMIRFGRKTGSVFLLAVLCAICLMAEPSDPGSETRSPETAPPTVEAPPAEAPAVETPAVEAPTVETPAVEIPTPERPAAVIHEAEIHEPETPAAETPTGKSEVSPSFYSAILSANSDSVPAGTGANLRNGSEGIPLFLLNRNGRMIAVPGISLETMDDVFRKIVGAPGGENVQLPEYIFHSVLAEGTVGKEVVSLKVRFQIETFGPGAVCVPLRFDEGILTASQTGLVKTSGRGSAKGPASSDESVKESLQDFNLNPGTETKPATETKPGSETKPGTETKPASESNSASSLKPAAEVTPSVSTADSLSVENAEGEQTEIYSEAAHRLNELVPVEKRYSGPGQVWVEFSEENGFTAWVVGKGVHQIELTFQVPYTRSQSGENQFKIQIPYATMSELNLEIPQSRKESEHLAVSMTGGTMLRGPYFEAEAEAGADPEQPKTQGKTRFSVIRLGGEFWLSWSEAPEEKTVTPDILEAEGIILAVISQDSVHYDARLKVVRKNADVNSFRVQLPVNAELIPQNSSDYSIAYVLNEKGKIEKEGTSGGPLVEVTLKKKFTGSVRVDIHAKLPISSPQAASEWFNMAGFSVLSAVRQAGYYAIKTTIGKHANWTPGTGMRRLEELPVPMELWEPVKTLEVGKAPGNPMGAIVYKSSAGEEKKTVKTAEDSEGAGAAGRGPGAGNGSTHEENGGSGESSLDQLLKNIPHENGTNAEKEKEDPYVPFSRKNDSQTGETSPGATEWESVGNYQSAWEAVFEYDSQPTPLWTRMVERTTRINIEPQYTVSVTQDKLFLEATWNCTIRGGKISWIDVNLNGWTFLSCGPESLTASEQINDISPSGSTSANISIPFNQPVGNHVILTFRAERALPEDAKDFEFRLPQKSGSQVPQFVLSSTPAELRIVSVPQLEVTPDSAKCRRLVRQPGSLTNPKGSESGGSIPLVYRCESEEAVFAANLLVHERQTQVRQYSQVELYRQEFRVRQTFSYSVAYKSINQLHFLVPDINMEDLEFVLSAGTSQENRSGKGFDAVSVPPGKERNFLSMKVPMEKAYAPTFAVGEGGTSAGSRPSGVNHSTGGGANAGSETGSGGLSAAPGSSEMVPALETVPGEVSEEPNASGENSETSRGAQPSDAEPGKTPELPSGTELAPGEISSRPVLKVRPSEEKPGFVEVDALLPEELLGAFTVSIAYTKPMPRLAEDSPVNVEIPLASSRDGKTTENLLELASDESLEMNSPTQQDAESPWEEMGTFLVQNQFRREKEFGEKPRNIPLQFLCKAEGVQNFIHVGASLRSVSPQEITLIDRCWIQTWISGESRRDRAVFLFPPPAEVPGLGTGARSDGTHLGGGSGPSFLTIRKFTVCLPKNAQADSAEVWIDRKPAKVGTEVKSLSPNKIQVTLPAAANPQSAQSVEIRYQFRISRFSEGCRDLEVPFVQDSTWIRSLYWQILLPENLHLAHVPQGFSLEYRWGWNQCFWGRVPLWEQETLERWAGAVKGTPIPSRMNRYILAGMGANEVLERPIHIRFVNRTTLVSVLALLVFLGGILMIYLEIFQKPLIRLGLFVVLAALAIRFPEYALLGIQAAALGIFLFFISIMFGLRRKMRHQIFVHGSLEGQTQFKTQIHQTVVAPSESSQHAFRTISYDQNPEVSSGGEDSTVIRQVKQKRAETGKSVH